MDKDNYQAFFQGKTVTLMGLGLLGRGVGDAAFLAAHCKKVYITDMKSEAELRDSVEALKAFDNIEYRLGGHDNELFENKDFVIKSAGVRLDNPYIKHACENGIPVYMSTALFVLLSSIKTIGVTGTRGKTTTTCMIADALKRAGKKVLMGGNLRGVSTLAQLDKAMAYDVAVLELDSWQLQGFDSLNISPNIAVFTTFYPDHMNYYDGDMDSYLHDKAAIFRNQKAGDVLVTTAEVSALIAKERQERGFEALHTIADPLPSGFGLGVPGGHNLVNGGLAKTATKALGVPEAVIDDALKDFQGVEGRLQLVGEWNQRRFFNDSNATTQDATLAALRAFPASSVVLIFGGADKGLPVDELVGFIKANKIRGVMIAGTGTDRIRADLPDMPLAGSMTEAVDLAVKLSRAGDTIILSPSFASFGVFKNEYDRSDKYLAEVGKILDRKDEAACQR